MPRRLQYILIAMACLACGSATCLYSGAGPMDPFTSMVGGAWSPWLAAVADGLTIPIPTQGIADVRDAVLFLFLGAALLIVAVGSGATAPRNDAATTEPAPPAPEQRQRQPSPARWLAGCAAAVLALAIVSLAANGTEGWGWAARFAAGAGWALLLARLLSPDAVHAALPWLLVPGTAAVGLGFAHASDRGYAHLSWPIGPITITAALAGCWTAMALTLMGVRLVRGPQAGAPGAGRRFGVPHVMALVAAIAGIAALVNTGRRASAIGLIAALVVSGAAAILFRWPTRRARWTVGIFCAAALAAAAVYVAREARSPERIRAGPLQVRLAYLQQSWKMIREHPLLGIGPDRFVVDMTNAMAPLRAVSPQVYHGKYDPAAHNEWLQAAVELGLPGGALYAALPVGVIFVSLRRARACGRLETALPLAAGLVAIGVTELASITLRGPIMPAWYWTLIGLLAATARRDPSPTLASASSQHPARAGIALLLPAAACFAVAAIDLRASYRALEHTRHVGEPAAARLYFEKQILDEYAGAVDELDAWNASPSDAALARLVERWRRLYERIPGYVDIPARYAECLMWAKRVPDAKAVLEAALSDRLNPYEPRANTVYAGMVDDRRTRLLCAQRALRSSDITDQLGFLITNHIGLVNENSELADELAKARRVAAGEGTDEDLKGPLIELLRVSACQRENRNDFAGMRDDLRLVADCYERMERESHPYRRVHEAEADAFFRLSRAIALADPSQYREALAMIRKAERFAVMGLRHEDVAPPRPELGYIGGEVVPTEFPARLRPMWEKSALYHLMAGDDRFLDLRIFASLDPGYWAEDELHLRLHGLARRAHEILSRLPPGQRPPHYDRLPAMADHYWKLATRSPRFGRPPPATAPAIPAP